MSDQIVLFNSGKTPIAGKLPDGSEYKLLPQKALCFPKSEADKLKRLYRDALIDEADARAKFSPATVMAETMKQAEEKARPTTEAPPATIAPVKMTALTESEKEQIRVELKELLKKLKARGMNDDEIDAMAGSANLAAEMETNFESADSGVNSNPEAQLQGEKPVISEPPKGLIRRLLDSLPD